jgi:hypothetical protein
MTQRLVGFSILWDLYRADAAGGSTNPFLPFFLEALEDAATDASEKKFLAQLLASSASRDVRSSPPSHPRARVAGTHRSFDRRRARRQRSSC